MSKIDRFPGSGFLVSQVTFYGIKLLGNEDNKSMQRAGVPLILW